MRVLVVSACVPFPPVGGGQLRTFHLTKALAERHDVTLAGFTFGETPAAAPFPLTIAPVPWEAPPLYADLWSADPERALHAYDELTFAVDAPWFATFYESPAMEERLSRLFDEGFDVVLFEGSDMARFLPVGPAGVVKVLDFMDVMTSMRRTDREGARREEAGHELRRTQRFESAAVAACDLCLTCSSSEASAALKLLGAGNVEVVPNGVDTTFFEPSATGVEDGYMLFTGTMSYAPNVEAVAYFTSEVLPPIRRSHPAARLHVVGRDPTPEVLRCAGDDVIVHGAVKDMRPFFRRAAVVVVPVNAGGGTRLKVLEAAACGKAIVSTSLGAEGLDLRAGENILLADSPADFASATLSLLGNPGRRRALGSNARNAALSFDWLPIGQQMVRAIEEAHLHALAGAR